MMLAAAVVLAIGVESAAPAPVPVAVSRPARESTPTRGGEVAAFRRSCESLLPQSSKNRLMQQGLERRLAAAQLSRAVRRHRLAVAVVDLSGDDEIYYAGVNDDDMMYAASLPKIAILLAAAQAAYEGRLDWTAEHDHRLGVMITESSNVDATWGAELVGLPAIETVVRDPRYCLYDDVHGGLWVGRAYAPGGDEHRDPLHDLSHGATARQAARFYALLDRERLVSTGWSEHLLALMGPPKHQHKFVRGLADRTEVTFLARKSGTWRHWHADSALIQHGDRRYVAVALSELRDGEAVMQTVIRLVDDLVMEGRYRRPQSTPRA